MEPNSVLSFFWQQYKSNEEGRLVFEDIEHDQIKGKILFEGASIPTIEKRLVLTAWIEDSKGNRVLSKDPHVAVYLIFEKKGSYKMRVYDKIWRQAKPVKGG